MTSISALTAAFCDKTRVSLSGAASEGGEEWGGGSLTCSSTNTHDS